MPGVHISPYAGHWYPGEAADLRALLEEKYADSRARAPSPLAEGLGFVVPHAGPEYSGTVAAAVYRTLRAQGAQRVVLLAFPHHGLLQGVATPDIDAVATPLGELKTGRDFAPQFRLVEESRVCDHSLEMQAPLLQTSVPDAAIVPLYVGRLDSAGRRAAATILAEGWRPGTVFVASSDLTHYGRGFGHTPFPADREIGGRLRERDFDYLEAAGSLDAERFLDTVRRREANVCGTGPIALLLEVLRLLDGDLYPSILDYQTSGELTGDWAHSVSYGALAFHRPAAFRLAPPDGERLLDSAAETLERLRTENGRHPVAPQSGSPALERRQGAFVSLHRGKELLGCVGNLTGRDPLREEIARLALSAALDDDRFDPLPASPGPVDIEISLLTPVRRIYRAADFVVGRHGGWLTLEHRSGLLLPQVAEGRGWTAVDFLRALERKSNLWKGAAFDPQARLYVFEAQIFSRPGLPAQS